MTCIISDIFSEEKKDEQYSTGQIWWLMIFKQVQQSMGQLDGGLSVDLIHVGNVGLGFWTMNQRILDWHLNFVIQD